MTEVVALEGVSFAYGEVPILDRVDLRIEAGEFLGIVGPNGGGKSTLLKLMLGLLQPAEGTVRVLGGSPAQARTAIGYVPQFAGFRRDFPITVEEAVLMGRIGMAPLLGGYARRDREMARQAMEQTEVLPFRRRALTALSGGELQRVLIARALACEPRLLLLDEPTANLDMRIEGDIFGLLQQLNAQATIVVVSHDVGFISQYVRRIACVNRTLTCHPTSEMSGEVIERLYGRPVRMIRHDVDTSGAP